jgi:NADH-quinone oxidoreductase subunit J
VSDPQRILALATLLTAAAVWLLLPRGVARGRPAGAVLAAAGLGLWASRLPALANWLENGTFLVLAGVTIAAALGAVSFANPVYCAIWFGMTLLGTAGLFLFQGAQFLAAATVIVYAGAILVTFLFVLMLGRPSGRASYDRVSWEAMLSAATGMLMVGVLAMAIFHALGTAGTPLPQALPTATAEQLRHGILAEDHVARLGAELFARHLVAVEVAGTLLLAAIVGTAAIAGHARLAAIEAAGREQPQGEDRAPAEEASRHNTPKLTLRG